MELKLLKQRAEITRIFLPVGLLTRLSPLWDGTIIKVKKHIRQIKIFKHGAFMPSSYR